jgi:hypothetical protein
MLLNIFIVITVLLALFFWSWLTITLIYMASAIFVWPPSMPTDARTRKTMIDLAKRYFPIDAEFRAADLGSGYGHLICSFIKEFKNATITGYEILRPPFHLSKFCFRNNPRVSVLKGDFLKHDLSSFDLIMTFYKDMKSDNRLADKLKNECREGTVIISNNFLIPGMEPKLQASAKLMIGQRISYLYVIDASIKTTIAEKSK